MDACFFLLLMLRGEKGKRKCPTNLAHFHFIAFILQETHEIVAIKKFKDSEGTLFCCMIFNVSNCIVNICSIKMRSLIKQDMILKRKLFISSVNIEGT